ncbi:MAG: DUF3820 family protein [Sulfurimonas sp.]|nr:DUF3820 family protein [Sulfurimonas sp.]
MPKVQLAFTKHRNSFNVKVINLESLSVEQIQALELFVKNRKGIFDFDTYTFVIQKKIEFNEFVSLIKYSNIEATCQEMLIIKKEKSRVGFGQYKGMYYSDIPDSYLIWLKSNYRGFDKEFIEVELKKRKL